MELNGSENIQVLSNVHILKEGSGWVGGATAYAL